MKKLSELALSVQLALFLGLAALIGVAGEYFYLNDMRQANAASADRLKKLQTDNEAARKIEEQLKQSKADYERLEQQLANQRTALPDEKESDAFIRMVQESGVTAGIAVRRFTARPVVAKEFYYELPFELEIDGSYNAVLQFFERLGKVSRIVNISNLAMGPITAGVRGVRKKYAYGPNTTVLAACTATTFYSREPATAAAAPPKR